MSEKTYTPFEVAIQVLDKVKELAKNCPVEVVKDEVAPEAVMDKTQEVDVDAGKDPSKKFLLKTGKPNKLEEFIANKKAKKTKQMEKTLGMQGAAPAAGAPGSSPMAPKAPKVSATAMGTENKKV